MFPLYAVIGAQVGSSDIIYLTYIDEGSRIGQLEFNPDAQVPSLKAKFVLEEEKGSDGLLHIRSCSNNKYWTIEGNSTPKSFIRAAAKEKVSDKKSAKCTLFRVEKSGSTVKLTHIQTGYFVHVDSSNNCLCIENQTRGTDFMVTDYGIFVKLPNRVILKGDNGNYLREYTNTVHIHAQAAPPSGQTEFSQTEVRFIAPDPAEPMAQFEVVQLNNCIRIKCLHNNKFLRVFADSDTIIFADSNDTSANNRSTLFEVILAESSGSNVIALRSRSNNKFCRRAQVSGFAKFFSFMFPSESSDALYASETRTKKETLFTVEEPVITRKIHLKYHLDEAIIIQRLPGLKGDPVEILNKSTKDDTFSHTFRFGVDCESSWKTSTYLSSNVKTEINFEIPKVKGGKFSVSSTTETTQAQQIESKKRRSYYDETIKNFRVPAMTKAIINWYVEELNYEVPFSYIQTDRCNDGTIEEHTFKDGTYSGMQGHEVICNDIKYERLH